MTAAPTFDLTPCLGRGKDQHFDRTSMLEGKEVRRGPRDRRSFRVRDQVAEQVAGIANAASDVIILGIEDHTSGGQPGEATPFGAAITPVLSRSCGSPLGCMMATDVPPTHRRS